MAEAKEALKEPTPVDVKVEFTGGLETIFSNKRFHTYRISPKPPDNAPPTVAQLVDQIVATHLSDSPKKELFVLNGAVRPGILVLINDADWELEGEAAYELNNGDEIVFVSTLHGG